MVARSPEGSELGQLAELAGLRLGPEDPAGFAAAIKTLVQNAALSQEKGHAARLLVEQR